jgi:hypothetical protein
MGSPAKQARPSPARNSRAWTAFFGPMGRPRQQKHGPTADSGRAWVANLDDFGKARPESPTARQETAHSGRAWVDIFRPDSRVRPGLGHHFLFRALSWPGPTRPGPRRCPGILLQHFILTKRGNIVGGLLFGIKKEGIKHCPTFSGQARFFRCVTRKNRPPGSFVDLKWFYLPVGGRFLVRTFGPKNPMAGFSQPLVGFSRPKLLQWSSFGRGYKYPPPFFLLKDCLISTKNTSIFEPLKSQDLLPQPTKALDLWRIKGEGLDLHSHRSDSLSPLVCLRDLCLGIPWNPRP